ncbi:MAG: CHAP domain-containing protein [Cyclobacteriaceae bacterium]
MRLSKKLRRVLLYGVISVALAGTLYAGYQGATRHNINPRYTVGEPLDSLHGVLVYYNGGVGAVEGRHLTPDGYNLGLKYQCVEFVKRYYYERYGHKMPDSYGHARSFFDPVVPDGGVNTSRDLLQYTNGSLTAPRVGDLIVFSETLFNEHGHVAIISKVQEQYVEITQQNAGLTGSTRDRIPMVSTSKGYYLDNPETLGWLRIKTYSN